jgi:o-succinylbenzoate---CoA ligase
MLSLIDKQIFSLKSRGVKGGMRVAFLAHPSAETLLMFFALWQIGAVACPLNPRWPESLQQESIDRLSPIFFWDKEPKAECPIVHDEGSLALLLFTSGSSGKPKIAAFTLANLLKNASRSIDPLNLNEESSWFLALPLCHVGGIGVIARCLLAQASVHFEKPAATHLSLVPTQLFRMLRDQSPLLFQAKTIVIGGAPLHPTLLKEALDKALPIYTTWGMTETSSMVTLGKADLTRHSGALLKGHELCINESNEILVRGETLFQGYLKEDFLHLPLTEEGWFATGDLGEIDTKGNLLWKGRKDRMFTIFGENTHPEEIEQQILSLPGMIQTLVVPVHDDEAGNVPIAYIAFEGDCDEPRWRSQLKERLPSFKVPRQFIPYDFSIRLKPSL